MTEQPLVSVLMTSYNREKYIGFAIESILASTYDNWELIIVDDGSTDKTVEIAKSFAQKDRRIRVVENAVNLGDYGNRNHAASFANGKYIKYIDADDAIYPWGLQGVVEMMERYPEAAYGLDSLIQDDTTMYPVLLHPQEAYDAYYLYGKGIFDKAPTSAIFRKDIFLKEGGFRNLRMVGDVDMWHRLSKKYPVLVMPDGIVWSRGHDDSQSGLYKNSLFTRYHYLYVKYGHLSAFISLLGRGEKLQKPLSRLRKELLKIKVKALVSFSLADYRHIQALENSNV